MHIHCSARTQILTVEQFFGLKCPEMLGSSKSALHVNPLRFPSYSACTQRFIPVASSSMAAKADFPNHPSLHAASLTSCILF